MSQGLQVWDAVGGIVLDTTHRIFRFHSQHNITLSPGGSKTIYIDGLTSSDSWNVTVTLCHMALRYERGTGYVRVYVSNNLVSGTVSTTLTVLRC